MAEIVIEDKSLENIKDSIVLITGACSGIGLATAELLVSLHAHVVGGDLQPPPQESPLTGHASFTFVRCDVTVWADLLALFDAAVQKHGRVDHVFANAGVATSAGDEYLADIFSSEGVLQEPKHPMLAVNLMGAANTLKLGVHHLRKNSQGGSLVANASAAGFHAMALADYCVSKSGLLALMRSLAIMLPEYAANVRINALAPWWTDTPILGARPVDAEPIKTQPASAVARAAVSCMVETSRHGETVFVMDERFHLVDAAVKQAVVSALPQPEEGGTDPLSRAVRGE